MNPSFLFKASHATCFTADAKGEPLWPCGSAKQLHGQESDSKEPEQLLSNLLLCIFERWMNMKCLSKHALLLSRRAGYAGACFESGNAGPEMLGFALK